MNEESFLDLSKVELFCWEREKSDLVINSILEGIKCGDDFPPVFVVRFKGVYFLDNRTRNTEASGVYLDGGHNRAIGHFIAGAPLKCLVRESFKLPYFNFLPVGECILIDDSGELSSKKNFFPNYR